MPVDGLKKVRKNNKPAPANRDQKLNLGFWHLPEKKSKKNTTKKALNLKKVLSKIATKKNGYISIVVMLFIIFSTFGAFSYNLVTENYDFVKMFKTGRYLVLFQNNSEMRATGGFIGSYAVFEIANGIIKNYYFDTNIYNIDKNFSSDNNITPPSDIMKNYLGTPTYALRDSNWSVDFPTAAKQISWFYEKEGGKPVDGIIAVNASSVSDLLGLIGPINMPEYKVEFNKDNFIDTAINKIERDYWINSENWTKNEPKTILKDLIPKVIERIIENGNYGALTGFVKKELAEKQILFYFYDQDKQMIVEKNNWGGEVKNTDGDYLYLNNSNLGNNKSSLLTKESFTLNTDFNETGNLVNTLNITRTNTSDGTSPIYGENKNYLRILVPNGSKIISAKLNDMGILDFIDTNIEAGKTEFGLWINVKPGETKTLTISYEPNLKSSKENYSIYIEKQPGNLGDEAKIYFKDLLKFNGIIDTDKDIK